MTLVFQSNLRLQNAVGQTEHVSDLWNSDWHVQHYTTFQVDFRQLIELRKDIRKLLKTVSKNIRTTLLIKMWSFASCICCYCDIFSGKEGPPQINTDIYQKSWKCVSPKPTLH